MHALTDIAEALAAAGQHEQAATVAGQAVAEGLGATGQYEHAAAVAGQAEALARSTTGLHNSPVEALAGAAGALAAAGQDERAVEVARSIVDSGRQAQALADVAGALAVAGGLQAQQSQRPTGEQADGFIRGK